MQLLRNDASNFGPNYAWLTTGTSIHKAKSEAMQTDLELFARVYIYQAYGDQVLAKRFSN